MKKMNNMKILELEQSHFGQVKDLLDDLQKYFEFMLDEFAFAFKKAFVQNNTKLLLTKFLISTKLVSV